jgi:predicted FMN-binding regulatory protein PaiB
MIKDLKTLKANYEVAKALLDSAQLAAIAEMVATKRTKITSLDGSVKLIQKKKDLEYSNIEQQLAYEAAIAKVNQSKLRSLLVAQHSIDLQIQDLLKSLPIQDLPTSNYILEIK